MEGDEKHGLTYPAVPNGAGDNYQYIKADAEATSHIQAYLEYVQIVGDTDGGVLLSEEEFLKRKKAHDEARKHRAYVSWRNNHTGMDCKLIGPQSRCMCGHKWKEHVAPYKKGARMKCRVPGCRCKHYDYLPSSGSWQVRCLCKHPAADHDPNTKKCTNPRCSCDAFYSRFTCSCGEYWEHHTTVVEGREEREAAGKAVNRDGEAPAAMGGLTDMTSLVDGAQRVPGHQGLGAMDAPMMMPPGGKEKMSMDDEMAALDALYKKKLVERPRPRKKISMPDPADRMQWGTGQRHTHAYQPTSDPPVSPAASHPQSRFTVEEEPEETVAQMRLRKRREMAAQQREAVRARRERQARG